MNSDLKRFHKIYGKEGYEIQISPVARWIVEHGFNPATNKTQFSSKETQKKSLGEILHSETSKSTENT